MLTYSYLKLADTDFYTEGPIADREGYGYVTTLRGGEVLRIGTGSQVVVWAKGDCPNGQVITDSGEHWFCESLSGQITRYAASGERIGTLIDGKCAGVPVSSPNDLILDSGGNLYFTDSIRKNGKVFYRSAVGREQVVAVGIDYANGLVLDREEKTLYVAESYRNRILSIDVSVLGRQALPRVFADLPAHPLGDIFRNLPDGLAMDCEGRLWVAHYGMQSVQVISPSGTLLFTLDTGLLLTSNLTFIRDEPAEKELLVTGGYGEPGPGAVVKLYVHF